MKIDFLRREVERTLAKRYPLAEDWREAGFSPGEARQLARLSDRQVPLSPIAGYDIWWEFWREMKAKRNGGPLVTVNISDPEPDDESDDRPAVVTVQDYENANPYKRGPGRPRKVTSRGQ